MIDTQDSQGFTPLHHAIFNHDINRVETLLRNGASPNLGSSFTLCTPLYVAAQQDQPEIIYLLWQFGADPNLANVFSLTPLMTAYALGCRRAVAALLYIGADQRRRDCHGWRTYEFVPLVFDLI